jgi:hypothetical protein
MRGGFAQLSAKLRQSGDTLANHDISKATGLTVGLVIHSVAESGRYPQAAKQLKHLATTAAQQWTMLMEVNRDGEFGELDPLQEEEINSLFAKSGREFYEQTVLMGLGALYQKTGRIKEGFAASQQAQLIYQELGLPLEAYPIPNWMKTIAKFARRSKVHLIGCAILGVFAFPFAIVGLVGIILYRLIRSRFARR